MPPMSSAADEPGSQRAAEVFVALAAPPGAEGAPAEQARAQYDSRVRGRRVQLSNVDRAAPGAQDPALRTRLARRERRARHAAAVQRGAVLRAPRGRSSRLPRAEREALGMQRVDAVAQLSPEQTQPLRELWSEYIVEQLGLANAAHEAVVRAVQSPSWVQNVQSTMLKADWVGSVITVVQSTNPALVHLQGTVVQETHETLVLCVEGAEPAQRPLRVVPKRNSVFRMRIALGEAGTLAFELHGNQLRYAPPARITRKHKARKTVELS